MGKLTLTFLLLFHYVSLSSQSIVSTQTYKKIDTIVLDFKIFKPKSFDPKREYSTVVLFHGGGFNSRYSNQFERHSKYFNSRNFIAITPVYRIKKMHQSTPLESCDDAKDLLDYIYSNAERYNINKDRIFVGGGSAGGLLALSTTFWKVKNNVVKGLILYNPIVDTGLNSALSKRRKGKYNLDISPIHHINKNHPPTLIFHGSLDEMEPIKKIRKYQEMVQEIGITCDVIEYPGQGHSFFNSQEFFIKTSKEVDKFLSSLGYIDN